MSYEKYRLLSKYTVKHQRINCYNQKHAGCHIALYKGIVCNEHLFTYN